MQMVVPPVYVGGRILRVVSPTPHLYEVEEWVGEWWEPSVVTLSVATSAPSASPDLLDAHRVPVEDRHTQGLRLSFEELSERMRAHVRDYTQEMPSPDLHSSGPRARRREYAGSAKFRRPRAPKAGTERRSTDAKEEEAKWTGPFRRGSDQTHESPPSAP